MIHLERGLRVDGKTRRLAALEDREHEGRCGPMRAYAILQRGRKSSGTA